MTAPPGPKAEVRLGVKATLAVWLLSLLSAMVVGAALSMERILAVILAEVMLAAPPLLFLLRRRELIPSLGLAKRPSTRDFLLGAAIGPTSFGLSTTVSYPLTLVFPPPEGYLDALLRFAPHTPLELAVWFLIVLLVVGPCEELLSRGFVQRGLEARFGKGKGLVLASVLFGLSHLDPWSSVGVAAAGLLMGYLYQRRSYSLWAPIGVHVGHDWLAFTALYLTLRAG